MELLFVERLQFREFRTRRQLLIRRRGSPAKTCLRFRTREYQRNVQQAHVVLVSSKKLI